MKRSSAELVRVYGPLEGLFVQGVSFDGTDIWIAAGDQLHALDRASGLLKDAICVSATAGTAFDGTYLYQIGDRVVRKIDRQSGDVVATFTIPGDESVSGMAWSDGYLWIGHDRGRSIDKVDPETGEVLRTIAVDHLVTGVTWHQGDLWHGSWVEDQGVLYRVDPDTGETLEQVDLPPGAAVTGLEADDEGNLICGGGKSGEVRIVRNPGAGSDKNPKA